MNPDFNVKEFENLIEDLRETNPEMSEAELVELASLVHNIQEMPELDAPSGLFEKVKSEINNQDSVKDSFQNQKENKISSESSWLDQFVSNLQSYLLPFSSGAVAMLVFITVFDLPILNTNLSESVQSKATYEDFQVNSTEFGISSETVANSPQNLEIKTMAKVQQPSKKSSGITDQKTLKNNDLSKSSKRRRIVRVDRKKRDLKAMGIGKKAPSQIMEPSKPGPIRSSMMASLSAKRDDWIPRKSKSTTTRSPQQIDRVMSVSQFSPASEYISSEDSLSSLEPSSEEPLNFVSDKSLIKKAVTYREVLELHWKISLEELKNARNLIKYSFSDVNHIRHLSAEDLDDYSEISGQILADSFFLKVDTKSLKDLIEKANEIGSFWIPDRRNPKLYKNLKDYLSKHPPSDGKLFDVQLKLVIIG